MVYLRENSDAFVSMIYLSENSGTFVSMMKVIDVITPQAIRNS